MKAETRFIRLEKEKRFHRKKTMLYRSNLLLHTERVGYLLEHYIPYAEQVFKSEFNSPMARAIAQVFDDFELEMGEMDPGERNFLEIDSTVLEARKKAAARDLLAHANGFSINNISYGVLLTMARKRRNIESQLVHWCDSLNGFGESLHEVYAGNREIFIEPVQNYVAKLRAFPEQHPKLADLCEKIPDSFAIPEFEEPTRPHFHTEYSVQKQTGYAPYDHWKSTLLKYGEQKALDSLVNRKESFPLAQEAAK